MIGGPGSSAWFIPNHVIVWIAAIHEILVHEQLPVVTARKKWRVSPTAHEVGIEQIFFDEHVDHRHRQLAVRAWLYLEPTIRFFRQGVLARIDNYKFCAT